VLEGEGHHVVVPDVDVLGVPPLLHLALVDVVEDVGGAVHGLGGREDRRIPPLVERRSAGVVERQAETEADAGLDLPHALEELLGSEQIDAAELVVVAPIPPGRPWRALLPPLRHGFCSFLLVQEDASLTAAQPSPGTSTWMISGTAASQRGIIELAALKWSDSTWAFPASASRKSSISTHRLGSSALRYQSKEMLPGSARVAVVNSSTSDGQSSAYLARTGCLTTMKIIRPPLQCVYRPVVLT